VRESQDEEAGGLPQDIIEQDDSKTRKEESFTESQSVKSSDGNSESDPKSGNLSYR
jgi:hypothetical protein